MLVFVLFNLYFCKGFFLPKSLATFKLFQLVDVAISRLVVEFLTDVLLESGVLFLYFFVFMIDSAVLFVLKLDETLLKFLLSLELPLNQLSI